MKHDTNKKYIKKVSALLLGTMLTTAFLAGCSSGNVDEGAASGIIKVANSPNEADTNDADKLPLGEASDFSFDFESMEYSFTGVENAEFYYIKVYPVVNGEESNSASFQSDKIDADETNSYSGVIEGENLLAGDYNAHVVASAAGYSSSDIQISGSSTMMASATVSANWNTDDDEGAGVSADITITAGDEITRDFTLIVINEAGSEVYRDDAVAAGTINLTAEDLGAAELSTEDIYNVTVMVNQVSGYTAPDEGVTVQITERMMFGGPSA